MAWEILEYSVQVIWTTFIVLKCLNEISDEQFIYCLYDSIFIYLFDIVMLS